MPSKRQPAKQRRAQQNRARRDALTTRSQHAGQPRPEAKATGGSSKASGRAKATAGTATAIADERPRPQTLKEWIGVDAIRRREPGIRMAFASVMVALGMFVVSPFLSVQVDDRGDVIPDGQFGQSYRGVYLAARSILSGSEVSARSETAWAASGPIILLLGAIPLLIVAGIYVAFRRTGKHLPLTIGMVLVFLLYMLTGANIVYVVILIPLAIASFQVRRAEMTERMAEQAAAKAEEASEDADEDLEDDEDYEDLEDEYDDEYTDEDEDDVEEDDETEYEDGDIYDEDAEDEDAEDEAVDDDADEDEAAGSETKPQS